MTTTADLKRRLDKLSVEAAVEVRIFIIDNIGANGVIEYTEEELQRRQDEAVKADPHKGIYIIDFCPAGGWMGGNNE